MQVRKVNLACSIHMLGHLHLHVSRRLNKGQRSMVRVGIKKPEGYRDVVGLALVWYGNSALEVQEVSFSTIVEHELIRPGSETLVVMKKGQDIPLGKVWVAVWRGDRG